MDDLTVIPEDQNSLSKVKFRHSILMLQEFLLDIGHRGLMDTSPDQYPLRHHFTPLHQEYGCCMYAREIFVPKGHVIIGKIHKHPHINFLLKGKICVATEHGNVYFEAPCTIVSSEIGLKKAAYAVEDVIWSTVHLTKQSGEEDLDEIEKEVIAETYEELGLISGDIDLKLEDR